MVDMLAMTPARKRKVKAMTKKEIGEMWANGPYVGVTITIPKMVHKCLKEARRDTPMRLIPVASALKAALWTAHEKGQWPFVEDLEPEEESK